MNLNTKHNFKEGIQTNEKKRTFTEITKINSSFKTHHFKVSRITTKIYEKESDKKVNQVKIISNDQRSFVRNQEHIICKTTNNDRILASLSTNSYKTMISQDLNNNKTYKVRNIFLQRINL